MAAPPVHVPFLEAKLDLLLRFDAQLNTRKDLAAHMGLKSASNLTAWARGTQTLRPDHVPSRRVASLAAAFDLSVEWLCQSNLEEFEALIAHRRQMRQKWWQHEPTKAQWEKIEALRRQQTIHFCAGADGVKLAYATSGSGAPLVKAGNWLNHLEHDWHCPVFGHFLSWLSEYFTLIRYDPRGTGLSEQHIHELSFNAFERDLETVIDAAGLERFVLFGTSQGAGLAANYAARHPERVSHLIMLGSLVSGWPAMVIDQEAIAALGPAIEGYWGQDNPAFRQMFTSMLMPDANLEEMHRFNEIQKITVSATNTNRTLETIGQMEGWRNLSKIKAPTLVLHARNDGVVRFEEGRRIAKAIPGAQFIALDSNNHILLGHEPAYLQFLTEVRRFLDNTGASI